MSKLTSSVRPTFSAVAELLQLLAGLALLSLGTQSARTLLDVLQAITRRWVWLAGLFQLLLLLACTAIAEYGPAIGHHLGRAAGRVYRLGRLARRWYADHSQEPVTQLLTAADYEFRHHVDQQLGADPCCQSLKQAIAPARLLSVAIVPIEVMDAADSPVEHPVTAGPTVDTRTRRQLLQLARERRLPGYSRQSTAELRRVLLGCE